MTTHLFLKDKYPYLLPCKGTNKYVLDIVETLFDQCPNVSLGIKESITNLYAYPCIEDNIELEQLVKKYVNCTINDRIIFTNGSDNSLKLIIDTFFARHANVLIPIPTYPHFTQMAETSYANINYVKCNSSNDVEKLFDLDWNIIYICSPNLPIGYESFDAIKKLLQHKDRLIIVDEAYFEYGSRVSAVQLLDNKNLIVVRTFSKFFGLASLRLGYLITCEDLYNKLRIMHNGKNVTKLATTGGTLALKNLNFYEAELEKFVSVKNYLKKTLPLIMGNEIYDFNLQSGNFFLIYAKDTKKVCKLFTEYAKCSVRDKSSEISDAIRISIAPLNIMKIVTRMINLINNFKNNNFIVDLDGTIRPDSKLMSYINPKHTHFLTNNKCIIVTNNTVHTKEEIINQLGLSANIPIYQPVCPDNYFIISKHHTYDINTINPEQYDGLCIFNSVLDVGTDVWSIAAKIINSSKPIVVSEDSLCTELNMASETIIQSTQSGEIIPDVGLFLSAYDIKNYKIVGKPNIEIPYDDMSIVIGDGASDHQLALKLNLEFIKIDPTIDNIIIDENYISIPNLTYLC